MAALVLLEPLCHALLHSLSNRAQQQTVEPQKLLGTGMQVHFFLKTKFSNKCTNKESRFQHPPTRATYLVDLDFINADVFHHKPHVSLLHRPQAQLPSDQRGSSATLRIVALNFITGAKRSKLLGSLGGSGSTSLGVANQGKGTISVGFGSVTKPMRNLAVRATSKLPR